MIQRRQTKKKVMKNEFRKSASFVHVMTSQILFFFYLESNSTYFFLIFFKKKKRFLLFLDPVSLILLDGFYLKTHIANTRKLPFSFYSIKMTNEKKWISSRRL